MFFYLKAPVLLLAMAFLGLTPVVQTQEVPLYTTNKNGEEQKKTFKLKLDKATSILRKIRRDKGLAKAIAYTYFKNPNEFAKSSLVNSLLDYHRTQFACLGGVCEAITKSIEEAISDNDILLDIFQTGKSLKELAGIVSDGEIEVAKLLSNVAQVTTGDKSIRSLVGDEIGTHLESTLNYYMQSPGTPVSTGEFESERVLKLLRMCIVMEAIEGMSSKDPLKKSFREALTIQLANDWIPLSRQLSGLGAHPAQGYHYFDAINGIAQALAVTTNSKEYMYQATHMAISSIPHNHQDTSAILSELLITEQAIREAKEQSESGKNPRLDTWIKTGRTMAAIPLEIAGGTLSIPAHVLNSMIHLADALPQTSASKDVRATIDFARKAVNSITQSVGVGIAKVVEFVMHSCRWLLSH